VLYQGYQHLLGRFPATSVACDDRQARIEIKGYADVLWIVPAGPVETIHRDDERYLPALEIVDGGKTIGEAAGIGEDHRAERANGQLVPHEPEPLLAGRPEQVEHEIASKAYPAEVHRDGRCGLPLDAGYVVGPHPAFGQRFFGTQRPDLAHRPDQRRLANPETASEQDLYRTMTARTHVRVPVGHSAPP
jgi:hypothetical protein